MAKSANEGIKTRSNYLRGTLESELQNDLTGAICEDDQQVIKFHGIYQQDDRDRRKVRADKKLERDYSFMIRLRIPGGKITASEWLGIDEVAAENSTGIIKITTRQTVQLHGVIKSRLKPTVKWFAKYNLDAIAACGDVNRNVMACAEPAKNKGYDEVYEYSKKISEHLLPQTNAFNEVWLDGEKVSEDKEPLYGALYLPRKFKIVIAIPPYNDVDAYAHDIGFIAVIEKGELLGFNVLAGGGMGNTHDNEATYPRVGDLIGYVAKDKVLDVAYQIVATQRDNGNREDRKLSRLKYTVDRMGVDNFKAEVERRLGFSFEEAKDFKFETRQDTYGWQQDHNGKWHYTLFVENGRILGEYLECFRKVAAKGLADFRFTNNQNIILTEVSFDNKAQVQEVLDQYELHNDYSRIRQNSMACVALNTCPLAVAEGQRYLPSLITKIEDLLETHRLKEEPITIRMTGCPNGCARPYLAEIAFVGKSSGRYNMYLGASPEGSRLNEVYKESVNEAEILSELDNLFGQFAKERESKEAFGDFVVRKNLI